MVTLTFLLCLISNPTECEKHNVQIVGRDTHYCSVVAQMVIANTLNENPEYTLKGGYECIAGLPT